MVFKKKRSRTRARTRTVALKKARSRSMSIPTPLLYGGYGAVRGKIASTVRNTIGNKLGGLGNVSDELLLGGTLYLAKKFIKNPMLNSVANAGLNAEAFNIGLQIGQNGLSSMIGGSTSTSNGLLF